MYVWPFFNIMDEKDMIKLQNFAALYLEDKNDEKLLRDFVSQQNHHFGQ